MILQRDRAFAVSGVYGSILRCAVGPQNASPLCTTMPLWSTVTAAGFSRRPCAKRGAVKTMS
jgi:hypothetical protein